MFKKDYVIFSTCNQYYSSAEKDVYWKMFPFCFCDFGFIFIFISFCRKNNVHIELMYM